MQRTLECSVCSDFYVPGTRPPKTLSCGHSFCAPCLHILYKGSTLNCPKCRTACALPDNNVDRLPTAYTVLEILDSVCGECHNQPHNGQCSHCDKNVCDPCREVHMAASQSDSSDDYDKLKALIHQLNDKLVDDQHLKAITTQRDTVIKELTRIKDDQIRMIEKYYDENVAKVNSRAQDDIDRRLKYTDDIDNTLNEAKKLLDKIRKQQYSKSNYDAISVKNQVKDIAKKIHDLEKSDPPMSTIACSYNKEDLTACWGDSFQLRIKSPSGSDVTNSGLPSVAAPDYSKMKCKQILQDGVVNPWDVCINPTNGQVIVADYHKNNVFILSESLDLLHTFEGGDAGKLYGPQGVACDGKRIFIAEYCHHRVCVTDVQGNVVKVFGSRGSKDNEFINPSGLALDTTGHLYMCDEMNHRIIVTTQQGVYVRDFGAEVFQDKYPYFLAISPDNKVAVTDTSGNLYLFTTSGQHIRTIPGQTPPHDIRATGVVFDGHGNILLADDKGGRVVVMSETGKVRCFIGTEGKGRGELMEPEGLAITHNNDIVVCDKGIKRLQIFSTK